MAKAEQIKALLKSYADGDENRFYSIAMQIAAHEAKIGHGSLAKSIRSLIDQAKQSKSLIERPSFSVPIVRPKGEMAALLSASFPKTKLAGMVLDENLSNRLDRIIKEQRHFSKLNAHGLSPRRKLMLIGPPGTGKTMSAHALAGELGLPLFTIHIESIITKFLGETASKLRQVFDAIAQTRGVYLFDEFDSIGSQRALPNEVGEIRRVLNSFLQFIDHDDSSSLILAATNNPKVLDTALYRRFDDIISYVIPDRELVIRTIKNRIAIYKNRNLEWDILAEAAEGLSYAEITQACTDTLKEMIIQDRKKITTGELLKHINDRRNIHQTGKDLS